MTERLFDKDSHLLEFDARVLSCEPDGGRFWISLDASAFAPEGGGQPSDIGYLDDACVVDVRERDGVLYHLTDKALLKERTVHGRVDYFRRLRHLQNHTGEHIVTGLFFREYGMNNVGFHLGHSDVTLDLDGSVDLPTMRRMERLANLVVAENREVRILYPDNETLARLAYRSKKEVEGRVRLVEIEGIDLCACCVPHVKRTGEVGGIWLLSAERYKGGTRIHMKCGLDAIEHANVEHDRENQLSMLLSLPSERIFEGVKKLVDDLAAAKYRIVGMKREKIEQRVREVSATESHLCFFENDFDVNELRLMVQGVVDKTGGVCAAFSGDDERGYCFVLADKSGAFEQTTMRFRSEFSAKGGGKAPFLQGTVNACETAIRSFFEKRN